MTTRLDSTESVEMREYLVMNDEDYRYWNAEIKADVSCSSEEKYPSRAATLPHGLAWGIRARYPEP